MTTPKDNTTPSPEQHNSLMDNLREPFQAWVAAGSRLGDVVSDFADRFREDRDKADHGQGAHAKPSPVEGEETTVDAVVASRPRLLDDGASYSLDVQVADGEADAVARLSAGDLLALVVVTGEG